MSVINDGKAYNITAADPAVGLAPEHAHQEACAFIWRTLLHPRSLQRLFRPLFCPTAATRLGFALSP